MFILVSSLCHFQHRSNPSLPPLHSWVLAPTSGDIMMGVNKYDRAKPSFACTLPRMEAICRPVRYSEW